MLLPESSGVLLLTALSNSGCGTLMEVLLMLEWLDVAVRICGDGLYPLLF